MSEKTARLKRDPNYLPVAICEAVSFRTAEARAPESGSFDWKVYYQSVLASLAESPASDYSIPNRSKLKKSKSYQRNVGSNNSHLSTLREQVIVNIQHRELVVFLTDEAQRFSKLASSSRQQVQMDVLQSIASMTNTLHGLFGTYELLEFRNLSGQLSRRSIDIHFSRYQADCASDLIEFQRVLKSFGEQMTLEKVPQLKIHWEYFYERSIGCVGILKDWLTQAYRKALDESASTLREHHWQPYAPSIAKCLQIGFCIATEKFWSLRSRTRIS